MKDEEKQKQKAIEQERVYEDWYINLSSDAKRRFWDRARLVHTPDDYQKLKARLNVLSSGWQYTFDWDNAENFRETSEQGTKV